MTRNVKILKSLKKSDSYLFVDQNKNFSELPAELQKAFGSYDLVMEMELSPSKKLARAEAREVLAAIESVGFYLQLPPNLNEIQSGLS